MLIDNNLIDSLCSKATKAARRRVNHNFHQADSDPLQRMLNVLQPGSYVQPHKHASPDKREAFIILTGRLLVILFEASGTIEQYHILDRDKGIFGIEIPPGTYHTIIALQKDTCVYEVKDGPYQATNDKHFAPWAPSEDTKEADTYLSILIEKTKKATLS